MTQPTPRAEALLPFAAAAYAMSLLLVVLPPLDIFLSMPVIEFSVARWRFGAVGLMTGALLLPMLGLMLALLTSVLAGHRWPFRIATGVGGLFGVLLLVALAMFVMDALQVRREVTPEMVRRFDVTVLKAIVTQAVQIGVIGMILYAGVQANRLATRAGRPMRESTGVLVAR